jgi:hypothetical protein
MVAEPLRFGWNNRQGQRKGVRDGSPQLIAVPDPGTVTPSRHKPAFHRKRGKFKPASSDSTG